MGRRAYLEGKFGGKENAIKAYMPVAEHAEKAGLKMNLEGIKTTPNTINAHRLIHWAGIEGVQTPIVSALFRAYFIEGRDIGDNDVLADVAAVGVYELDNDACGVGEELRQRDMQRIKTCKKRDEWPGYSNDISTLSLPRYATIVEFSSYDF